MTGQVKEEVLCRFAELGVRVKSGVVRFEPGLLRRREFVAEQSEFEYLDVNGDWQQMTVLPDGLAFTWCQVPILYRLDDAAPAGIMIEGSDGSTRRVEGLQLSAEDSVALFTRSGEIRQLAVTFGSDALLAE